jgi:hypothetical protein
MPYCGLASFAQAALSRLKPSAVPARPRPVVETAAAERGQAHREGEEGAERSPRRHHRSASVTRTVMSRGSSASFAATCSTTCTTTWRKTVFMSRSTLVACRIPMPSSFW